MTTNICFLEWHRVVSCRSMVRGIVKLRNRQILASYFNIFRLKVKQQIRLKVSISLLCINVYLLINFIQNINRAVGHRFLTNAFSSWQLSLIVCSSSTVSSLHYVNTCQDQLQLKVHSLQAAQFRHTRLLRRCVDQWKAHVMRMHQVRAMRIRSLANRTLEDLRTCWDTWSSVLHDRLIERSKLSIAMHFWQERYSISTFPEDKTHATSFAHSIL